MLNYDDLQALDMVIREKGFVNAAKTLHISQSAVSQRIKNLEDRIGHPLIIRGNPVTPTSVGQQLITHFHHVALLEESLMKKINPEWSDSSPHPIPIALNKQSLNLWFIQAVAPLLKKGNFIVDVMIDDEDKTLHLLREGKVFGCVTSSEKPANGCISIPLGILKYICVCTPEFYDNFFRDKNIEEAIFKAPAVNFGGSQELLESFLCQLGLHQNATASIQAHTLPDPRLQIRFVLNSFGYGLLPRISCEKYLKEGSLVNLFAGKAYEEKLYWQTRDQMTEQSSLLLKHIVEYSQSILD